MKIDKNSFGNADSDLLASGTMYFEDFIICLHTNFTDSQIKALDAFSLIEITTNAILHDMHVDNVIESLRFTLSRDAEMQTLTKKIRQFHAVLNSSDTDEVAKHIKYTGKFGQHEHHLIVIFLNHLTVNFLKILTKEKGKINSSNFTQVNFARLLSAIFDEAFEKTLNELRS